MTFEHSVLVITLFIVSLGIPNRDADVITVRHVRWCCWSKSWLHKFHDCKANIRLQRDSDGDNAIADTVSLVCGSWVLCLSPLLFDPFIIWQVPLHSQGGNLHVLKACESEKTLFILFLFLITPFKSFCCCLYCHCNDWESHSWPWCTYIHWWCSQYLTLRCTSDCKACTLIVIQQVCLVHRGSCLAHTVIPGIELLTI